MTGFHYPSTRAVLTGNGNGPSTRVVETGLNYKENVWQAERVQLQELMRTRMRSHVESDSDHEDSDQLDAKLLLRQDSEFSRY